MFRAVANSKTSPSRPDGHVLVPAAAIGSLSILLVAGLSALGILDHINAGIAGIVSRGGAEKFPKHLADWCIWLSTAIFAFGLACAILGSPGSWRRLVLWASGVVLVAAWAPVLSLAAHAPDIAAPWIATFWSGVCSLVYAANHQMACDQNFSSNDDSR